MTEINAAEAQVPSAYACAPPAHHRVPNSESRPLRSLKLRNGYCQAFGDKLTGGSRHFADGAMAVVMPWLKFALCLVTIGVAGPALIRNGEVISQHTGLSRSWIGLILIATATSLPELFTGLSSVAVTDAPNIAVGDVLGSCVLNLVMLVLLDELSRKEPLYRRIDQGHILTAGFGVILLSAAGAFLLLSQDGVGFQIVHISAYTPLIIILYFVAIRAAFVYERRASHRRQTRRGATLRFVPLCYAMQVLPLS